MKHWINNFAIVWLFGILVSAAGCSNHITATTPSKATDFNGVNSATFQSANGLSLSLSLDSKTYQSGLGVTIIVDEMNTLSKSNKIPATDKWPYSQLVTTPCDFSASFGIALFQGDYTSSNFFMETPLHLYDPKVVYTCSAVLAVSTYFFQPSSDIANLTKMRYTNTVKGYWSNDSISKFKNFEPGIYTIVAGDEWGALVVLHFTVTNTAATSLTTITASSQQPIEVVSVSDTYKAGEPINPGGPTVEITLKNVSTEPIISLALTLDEGRPVNYHFDLE